MQACFYVYISKASYSLEKTLLSGCFNLKLSFVRLNLSCERKTKTLYQFETNLFSSRYIRAVLIVFAKLSPRTTLLRKVHNPKRNNRCKVSETYLNFLK